MHIYYLCTDFKTNEHLLPPYAVLVTGFFLDHGAKKLNGYCWILCSTMCPKLH